MSKTVDFKKSIQGLNEQDLQARINEDEVRLKTRICTCYFSIGKSNEHQKPAQRIGSFEN
jgi:hypothetical protein